MLHTSLFIWVVKVKLHYLYQLTLILFFSIGDPDYLPQGEGLEDKEVEYTEHIRKTPDKESKYIVFESELLDLFVMCTESGCLCEIASKQLKTIGSLLVIKYTCKAGHIKVWSSQPCHKGMGWGNLIASASVLYSGNSFSSVSLMFQHLNVAYISPSTFYKIQCAYISVTINGIVFIFYVQLPKVFGNTFLGYIYKLTKFLCFDIFG